MNHDSQLKLAKLHENYQKNLPVKLASVDEKWTLLKSSPWQKTTWGDFYLAIHSLVGSSSTYGYRELSEKLRVIELTAKNYLDQAPHQEVYQQITAALEIAKGVKHSSEPK